MSQPRFANRIETTLSAPLSDVATSMSVTSTAGFPEQANPYSGEWSPVWITATLEAGGQVEVVKIASYTGTTCTIQRAQEGTEALAWSAGTPVKLNWTAAHANLALYNERDVPESIMFGHGSNNPGNFATFPDSATQVDYGEIYRHAGSPNVVFVCHQRGVTGSPPVGDYSGSSTFFTGSAGFYVVSLVKPGTVAVGVDTAAAQTAAAIGSAAKALSDGAVALGFDSMAIGSGAAAIGYSAKSLRGSSIALGHMAACRGIDSIALGLSAETRANYSVAVGFGVATFVEQGMTLSAIPVSQRDDWWMSGTGSGSDYFNTLPSVLHSHNIDLGNSPAWQANTAYKDGHVVAPTTPNGYQYVLWGYPYTPGVENTYMSGTVEPVWPAEVDGSVEADGNGDSWWISFDPLGGFPIELPPRTVFAVREVGFVCFEYANVTAAPTITVEEWDGPVVVNAVALDQITGAGQFQAIPISSGPTVGGFLRFKVVTKAAGANSQFLGRFYAQGVFFQVPG